MYTEENNFDKESKRAIKNWGGATKPEEEFDAFEFFGDAGDAAQSDIEAEFGEDEFTPFGSMEDPRMLKDLSLDDYLDEVIGEGFDQKGLLQLDDAEGNIIKKDMLVKSAGGGDKKGRVVGFGDEQGMPIVIVDWAWPTDMKFTDPSEMGKKRENPENLIVQGKVNEDVVDDEGEDEFTSDSGLELDNLSFDTSSLYKWILDALYQLDIYSNEDKAQAMESAIMRDFDITPKNNIEEARGLGHGVKNSGDRNVKLRDDHHGAPLTNLSETIDDKIKNLSENKISKKDLITFIKNEAKNISKNI